MVKKVIKEGALSAATGAIATVEPLSGVIASVCKDTYKAVAEMRAYSFFNKIQDAIVDESEDKKHLEKLIKKLKNSGSLQESLFDFTQSAIRTRSNLAITMLAFAYTEIIQNDNDQDDFYLQVCQTLPITTDKELKIIEALGNVEDNILFLNKDSARIEPSDFPRIPFTEDFEKYIEKKCQIPSQQIIQAIYTLHNRTILQYDTAGYGGGLAYTITENTVRYRTLLQKAKTFLHSS